MEKNSFSKIMLLINLTITEKNGVKQININHEILLQSCIFYPTGKDQTLATMPKCSKNYFLRFLLTFLI